MFSPEVVGRAARERWSVRRGVGAVVGVDAGPVGRQTERYVHLYCALGESMSNSGRSPRYKQRNLHDEEEQSRC